MIAYGHWINMPICYLVRERFRRRSARRHANFLLLGARRN